MSLTTAQRYQFLRLVIPDGSVDIEDQYAFGFGLAQPQSYVLTSTQLKQFLRLPVVDATVSTNDKYALLGYCFPANPAGALIEFFDLEWTIDPTWAGYLLPQANAGVISTVLEGITSEFLNANVRTPAIPEVLPETDGSGGYGWESDYAAYRQRKRAMQRRRKKIMQALKEIVNPVDREIAQLMHAKEREAEERANLRRLLDLLTEVEDQLLLQRMAELQLMGVYESALKRRTFSTMQRLDRMMDRAYTEEEQWLMSLLSL
jgi:hypothetical protein